MNATAPIERVVAHHNFSIERDFKSSPDKVWAAFANKEKKEAWFGGGDDWTDRRHEFDFRVGGREYESGRFHGGVNHIFEALYYDIVPNERIVYTYEMHLDAERISVSLATIEFEATATGGTHLTLTEQGAFLDGFDNGKQREEGTHGLLDMLVRHLDGQ